MLKIKHTRAFLITLLLLSLTFTLSSLLAQADITPTPSPSPAPVDLTCDLAELQAKQAELNASLASFDEDAAVNAGAALDNLFKVGAAYQQLALDCGYIPADAAERAVGTDVDYILRSLETVTGDPLNGQLLYNGDLACASCHETSGGVVAPHTEGTYTRVEETRLNDPVLADYTPEHYLAESIVMPGNYVVPGYNNVMPSDFGERLTLQELADLIAFLESQDGPSPE